MIKEISVAKELVALIGRDADADIDVIIADAALELLTRAEQKKPQPAVGGGNART